MQIGLDLRKLIRTGNNPDGPASCYCKFPVVFSLPVSSAVRCRVLWRKTIGAGTRVRLGFPNARPVVSDERSEEFRRSVKESLTGPFQANRSDGIKPGIGIERKNKPTISLEKRKMKVYLLPHFRSKRLNFLFHPIKIQPDKKSYFPKHDSDPDD